MRGVVLLGMVVAGARVAERTPPAPDLPPAASSSSPAAVGAPFDVGGVIRHVQLAFRPDRRGFRGGDGGYEVRASERGVVRIAPRRRAGARQPGPLELETVRIERASAASDRVVATRS